MITMQQAAKWAGLKSVEEKPKCFGKLFTCDVKPKYIAEIKSGPGMCFNGSLWCEDCMGKEFRKGNPYLKEIGKEVL